jgi:hypothetical protein
MSSRHLHPLACRVPRADRNAIVAIADARGMSISALIKEALFSYLKGVHSGVNLPPIIPVANAGPGPSATGQQSTILPRPKTLADLFVASPPAAPNLGKPNGCNAFVETDIGIGALTRNRRSKPQPQGPSPRGKSWTETW